MIAMTMGEWSKTRQGRREQEKVQKQLNTHINIYSNLALKI